MDFETVRDGEKAADHCVTIRERDSMEQVRIPIDQVKDFLREKVRVLRKVFHRIARRTALFRELSFF